jgi:hypothetical protein
VWVMVSGPYTAGAATDAQRRENLALMNRVALQVLAKGHLPVIGVNMALPMIEVAGPSGFDRIMMPVSLALAERCDACLRIGGPSAERSSGEAVFVVFRRSRKPGQPPHSHEGGAMNRFAVALLIALAVGSWCSEVLSAQASASPAVRVCSLLPKAEVKRHVPWIDALDRMKPEEEAIGASGSSCSYPSVHIQVLPSSSRIIEIARKRGGLEKISGIGDEAYFYNNSNGTPKSTSGLAGTF